MSRILPDESERELYRPSMSHEKRRELQEAIERATERATARSYIEDARAKLRGTPKGPGEHARSESN